MERYLQYPVVPMTEEAARAIAAWQYPEPFTFYNGAGDPETVQELLNGDYVAVLEPDSGQCAGYFCFGKSAQVPSGHKAGVYRGDHLDLGLGLHPDEVGQGNGLAFVKAAMSYAKKHFRTDRFRLTVATFNRPAIRVYEKAGFDMINLFYHPVEDGAIEFITMEAVSTEAHRSVRR